MTIRTRPATDAYREGWERTFLHPKSEVYNFDTGVRWQYCGICGIQVDLNAEQCSRCGVDLRTTGSPMVVTAVDRENGTITVETK